VKPTLSHFLIVILFLALVIFALSEFLDAIPLYLWDESRQAINALEMYQNNNWLVTYYDGVPDMWNTKPPLLIWIQVFFIHLFGPTVTAIRAVSAIAGIITCLVLFRFIYLQTKQIWLGFFSGIILVSIQAFNGYHGTRSGDYDSLLTLFMLLAVIQFYYYSNTLLKKHILLFFLFLSLGCLTKGIAALLLMPTLFVYSCITKKTVFIFKDKYFYLGCISFCIVIVLYYCSRELANPGYLKAVYANELGGRYLQVNEGHRGDGFFYLKYFFTNNVFLYNYVLVILLILYPFINPYSSNVRLFEYLLIIILSYFSILSFSKTKIVWYIMPSLPFIAGIIPLLLYDFTSFLYSKFQIHFIQKATVVLLLISILGICSYSEIIKVHNHPEKESDDFYRISTFFHTEEYQTSALNLKVASHFKKHIYFYIARLRLKHQQIEFKDYKKLNPQESVIVSDPDINVYIKNNYSVDEIYTKDILHIYTIRK